MHRKSLQKRTLWSHINIVQHFVPTQCVNTEKQTEDEPWKPHKFLSMYITVLLFRILNKSEVFLYGPCVYTCIVYSHTHKYHTPRVKEKEWAKATKKPEKTHKHTQTANSCVRNSVYSACVNNKYWTGKISIYTNSTTTTRIGIKKESKPKEQQKTIVFRLRRNSWTIGRLHSIENRTVWTMVMNRVVFMRRKKSLKNVIER